MLSRSNGLMPIVCTYEEGASYMLILDKERPVADRGAA